MPKVVFLHAYPDPDTKVQELHAQLAPILEHDAPNPRLVEVVRNMHLIARGNRLPIRVVVYVDMPRPSDWADADIEALEDAAFGQLWIERIFWSR